jgi:hypothetical protein
MKIKFSKKWIIIILTALLVITTSLLIGSLFMFESYWRNNPQITNIVPEEEYSGNMGLVSHWEFDEIDNITVKEISGNNNHGEVRSIFYWFIPRKILSKFINIKNILVSPKITEGVKGNAFEFDGRQWIVGGNKKAYNTNKFTITVWAWRERDIDMVPTIMAKSSWPIYDGWWLCTKPRTKFIDMGIAWGDSFAHIHSDYEMPLKEWHHIAVTMNNTDHEIEFYIDGKLFGEKHTDVPEWLVNWNHDLMIGEYDGSARWPWIGRIDDPRYYDRILNAEEILAIYNFEEVR